MWFGLWAVVGAKAADQKTDVRSLSNDELIQEYERMGLALQGTLDVPTDELVDARGRPRRRARRQFEQVQKEIVRRGKESVPPLLKFLEAEAATRRPADKNGIVASFTGDALGMLVKIGDPRAVPVALRILEGVKGVNSEAGFWVRRAPLDAIEALTFCSFRQSSLSGGRSSNAVEHPDAVAAKAFANPETAVRLYRDWLAGEGKDPTQWLSLAQKRARRLLDGGGGDPAWCAAVFLCNPAHDDDPEATVKRLGVIVNGLSASYNGTWYWTRVLARLGPRARPYAKSLIRIQRERSLNKWSGYEELGSIGGVEIMDYLIEVLPRIGAEVAKLRADPATPKGFGSDDPRGWWFASWYNVQWAIDRWAGRTFGDDAERIAWWKENKDRPPEAWLTDNLETLVEQADAGFGRAAGVAASVLPDLPKALSNLDEDAVQELDAAAIEKLKGPFRAEWLRENRAKLKYDPQAGVFRLAAEGAAP
jgi:hypothetical protein